MAAPALHAPATTGHPTHPHDTAYLSWLGDGCDNRTSSQGMGGADPYVARSSSVSRAAISCWVLAYRLRHLRSVGVEYACSWLCDCCDGYLYMQARVMRGLKLKGLRLRECERECCVALHAHDLKHARSLLRAVVHEQALQRTYLQLEGMLHPFLEIHCEHGSTTSEHAVIAYLIASLTASTWTPSAASRSGSTLSTQLNCLHKAALWSHQKLLQQLLLYVVLALAARQTICCSL